MAIRYEANLHALLRLCVADIEVAEALWLPYPLELLLGMRV